MRLVLNPATGRMESPLTAGDFGLLPGVIPALRRLQAHGYPLILVSNQPNYALGKSTLSDVRADSPQICDGVSRSRHSFCARSAIAFIIRRESWPGFRELRCRKPSPWFLLRARDDFHLSLAGFLDDRRPAHRHGVRPGGRGADPRIGAAAGQMPAVRTPAPTLSARDLAEAAEIVLGG